MPQLDKFSFFSIIIVSLVIQFISLFLYYLFAFLPIFSNLRMYFDMSKDVLVRVSFLFLDSSIWLLFIISY
jgi:hypothetical protein